MSKSKIPQIRYAVVGLGDITQVAALPAFHHCELSRVTAFVSSDPEKHAQLGERYGVSHSYRYEQFEECLESGEVDAVYIGLPNHMHRDFTERAAKLGRHVLCEKPMAPTAADCQAMIDISRQNNIKLMIAYRLHFEEGNLEAIHTGQSGEIGDLRFFSSCFSQQVKDGNVRIEYPTAQGGGVVFDMGVYCINAARYLFQSEPIEISATAANNGDPRFGQTDEMVAVTMRFPEERLAQFTVSFGAEDVDSYTLCGTKGNLTSTPAYGYVGEVEHSIRIGGKDRKRTFPRRDQFAAEFDYFSDCILNNREPEPNGVEGLIDVRIVEAIHQAASSKRPIPIALSHKGHRPSLKQSIYRPPVTHAPEPVHASSPKQ